MSATLHSHSVPANPLRFSVRRASVWHRVSVTGTGGWRSANPDDHGRNHNPRREAMRRGGSKPGGAPGRCAKTGSSTAGVVFEVPPGVTQRPVQVKNKFGETLAGVFVDAGTDKVVVLCHGFASSKNGFHFPVMAAELAKKTLSSVRFDFSGNGESQGVFDFGNYTKEMGEIRAIVAFVRDNLKKTVIGLVGHSKGGNDVLLYASCFDDVPYVVNIAGRFDMKHGIAQRFGEDIFDKLEKFNQVELKQRTSDGVQFKWLLTKRSMEERLATDMQEASEKIKVTEILTIHGTEDPVIPFEDAKKFSEYIRPHVLFPVEAADHNFNEPSLAQIMIQKTVNFFTSGL